jgi:transcriptional regulator with GAF, ATPase, and Fis domain
MTVIEPGALESAVDASTDESRRRLRLLLEIATVLDSFDDSAQLLERFGGLLIDLLAPSCSLIQIRDASWAAGREEVSVSQTVMRRVLERGEALLMDELDEEPLVQIKLGGSDRTLRKGQCRDWREQSASRLGIRSVMGAPVLQAQEVMGLLYVDRRAEDLRSYEREELHLLIAVGRLLSAALAGSERLERLEAQGRMQSLSGHISGMVVGESPAMRALRETIERRIGPVQSNLLLIGETGTGKTMSAEAVHLASPRRGRPFIKVNCAAIPRELLESELFGYERGAFSGAHRRKIGQFEAAAGGTLFLDEIGELDPSAQAKLLTVVEDRAVLRVGSVTPVKVDVRLIAATSRDIEREVEEGRFRKDLFYRLNVVRLEIPPLRSRTEDVPLLARHLLERACHEIGRQVLGFDGDVMEVLQRYHWPGNVRELANAIERAVIYADDGARISSELLPPEILDGEADIGELDAVAQIERQMVKEALDQAGGNKREAARRLGWYPQKLYNRIRRYGLDE